MPTTGNQRTSLPVSSRCLIVRFPQPGFEEIMMKIKCFAAVLLTAAAVMFGPEASARVNVDINIGPPAPIIVAPVPPPRHRFYVERRPRFMFTPPLGFYVSVDGPYDMVFYGDRYYIHDEGRWFGAPSYDGPWVLIEEYRLPGRIRRYRYSEIRHYRDEEFRRHGRDDNWHDRGRGRDWGPGHDNGRWH